MKPVLEDLKPKLLLRAGEPWDITEKISREGCKIINEIVQRGEISQARAKRFEPKHCHAPRLIGYPKIHKENVPLRGVVSFTGTPYEKASRELIPVLREIQGRSGLYVKNSRELKEKIKDWRIERNEILVSYDVEKLYPSIPIREALDLVECLLKSKPNLQGKPHTL